MRVNQQLNREYTISDVIGDASAILYLQGQIHIKIALFFITQGTFFSCQCPTGCTRRNINISSFSLRKATADRKELPVYTSMAEQLMGGLQRSLTPICLLVNVNNASCHCRMWLLSLLVSMTFFLPAEPVHLWLLQCQHGLSAIVTSKMLMAMWQWWDQVRICPWNTYYHLPPVTELTTWAFLWIFAVLFDVLIGMPS